MNKKSRKYLIILAVLLIAGIVVFFLPSKKKPVTVLETSKVSRGNISTTVTATGTVEPIRLVEVGTQVSGVISKIYVDYNSVVKEGEVLAELDKMLLQSELESAEATLNSRQVELEYQRLNYDRRKELYARQAISKADWEEAETSYETARLAVISAEANVLKARTNLGYATIYATIDGVVISRDVEEGQTVAASFSTPTLFTIANDLTKMRVIADVDEADIGGVKEGQRVSFSVDAYPEDEFEGQVIQVRLEATNTSNVITYQVVIDAPNPDLKLKPGLTANVAIYTMEENDVLIIPSRALRFQPNAAELEGVRELEIANPIQPVNSSQKIVWVKSGNSISPKSIGTGAADRINIEVTHGLQEGEEVVLGITQTVPDNEDEEASGEKSPFMPQRPGGRR